MPQTQAPWRGSQNLKLLFRTFTYLNAARVRLEAACRVLGCDSALDGAAIDADVLLPQAQVRQAPALSHVDLCMDQVHTAEGNTREERHIRWGTAAGHSDQWPTPSLFPPGDVARSTATLQQQ